MCHKKVISMMFFEEVKWLYNLAFFKEEKGYRAKVVKKCADELFKANRISDYIRSIIGEAKEKFVLLSPSKSTATAFE